MTDAAPDPELTACMLQRAGDLAHLMLRAGASVHVAAGLTPNGHPCTVIYAIGDMADVAKQVGERLVEEVARRRIEQRGKLRDN